MATKRQKPNREIPAEQRYGSDVELCRRLGITVMTLWRWRNTPELKFPKPAIIRGRPRNDFAVVDEFMAKRAKSRAA